VEIGQSWPPYGVSSFFPLGVPFLNTLILLSSGVRVTFSHHYFLCGNYMGGLLGLVFTLFLGAYFTAVQALEYYESFFCFRDSCYGRVFFIGTGFHGLHVLVGTVFLFVCFLRFYRLKFGVLQMTGFDLAV
jgi:heme/copper-type cytochrome/quinol oxidase subunit 3